jgi:hypothetical protein
VGTAGAEGFGPAFIGPYLKDAGEDESIRDKDGENRQGNIDAHYDENQQLIDIGAGAGKLEQGEDVTEIIIDIACIAEG